MERTLSEHAIIPHPTALKMLPGCFLLKHDTVILADSPATDTARYLAESLAPATGFLLNVESRSNAPVSNIIWLDLDAGKSNLGDEGYEMLVRPERIRLTAHQPAGLFYACQTLRQLLPASVLGTTKTGRRFWPVPCLKISDSPRFPWRGLMLDPARAFLPKDTLLRIVDLLAFYKMNRLHLHLTDSESWTLEIKRYPRLTDPTCRPPAGGRNRGYYTQSDMKEIVAYAARRHVSVVPEIEFPAHAATLLNAYPELRCRSISRPPPGVVSEMCPGNEKVYRFIRNVIQEVTAIFNGPYLHIGGDEYFGAGWADCPVCRRKTARASLASEDTPELRRLFRDSPGNPHKYLLYRYLMRRVAGMVVDNQRIPVLWDDMAWRGKFPEKSVIMQWHYPGAFDWAQCTATPEHPALEAAEAGHDTIVASCNYLYFNYFDGGALLRRLYDFEPVPAGLPVANHRHVMGPHACLWVGGEALLDRLLFPRLLALAEKGWTAKSRRRWDHFHRRLVRHLPRLKIMGVQYARPCPGPSRSLTIPFEISDPDHQPRWQLNRVVAGNGRYEARVRIANDRGRAVQAELILTTRRGNEKVPCCPVLGRRRGGGARRFQFNIAGFEDEAIYYLRLRLRGADATVRRGQLVVRKIRC